MFDAGDAEEPNEAPVGTIKVVPNEFIVREISPFDKQPLTFDTAQLPLPPWVGQSYSLFKVVKMGVSHLGMIKAIANQLGVPQKCVSTFGRKDTHALTVQYVVVEGEYHPRFQHNQMFLNYLRPHHGRIYPGGHGGNHFTITVRTDATELPSLPPENKDYFLNLYGPQRFGDERVDIGRLFLEGCYEEAVELLRGSYGFDRLEREACQEGVSLQDALTRPYYEEQFRFRIQQWQSWLWNQLANVSDEPTLPMWDLGCAYRYADWWLPDIHDLDPVAMEYLAHNERELWVPAVGHTAEVLEEGGAHKHTFSLGSGSYATTFLQHLYDLRDASIKE